MANPLRILFSSEKRAARLERDLQRNILDDQPKAAATFCKLFLLLLREKKAHSLSNLVLSYCPRVSNIAALEGEISSRNLKQAISLLEENRLDSAALMLCDCFGYDIEAIDILAKRAQAGDLSRRFLRGDQVDKELLHTAITLWEQYHGSIETSPTMSAVVLNVAKFAPESIPDNPRVKEIVGRFAEAAVLYAKEGQLGNAARCYERAAMYNEACQIYEHIGDNEGVSRAAESLGDLEKASKFAINPERKLRLLLRIERFTEAHEIAATLESPGEYFDLIKQRAKERLEIRKKGGDFVGALELADIAGYEFAEREEILQLGRQHLDRKLASAVTEEDIKAIFQERVALEERAGNFEEAGRIAEEVLEDLDRASLLYEKANLFNRAIGTASGLIRLAELHERGGSLLEAARLYESAGQYDKAFALYESLQRFDQAIACYLKTPAPRQDVLVRLYTAAGEFEKAIEIYMTSENLEDLEKALSLATTHRLTTHIRVIREKMASLVSGSEKDLQQCFTSARDEVLSSYSATIGIDFGTTNSVVAIFNKKTQKIEIVPNARGYAYEPSFFGVDEYDRPIFGEAARLRSLTAPECVVSRVKRSLGKGIGFSINGKPYKCEQIVAHFLQHLRSNAVAYVQSKVEERFHELLKAGNLRFHNEMLRAFLDGQGDYVHLEDVVLSVPAYFNDNQKRAARDSAEIAGLRVKRLLHEPSAAALAYSQQKPYSGTLAVIDLGGGTLDISIVDIGEGVDEVLAVYGDTELGGSDIDNILVQRVIEDIKDRWGVEIAEGTHPSEIARLRNACEDLKIRLSSVTQSTLELQYFLGRPQYTFTLTRTELERLSRPILDRIQQTIENAFRDYGSKVDNFLLVGHATKMPAVAEVARRIIPAQQLAGIDPGTVVATGAAFQGACLAGEFRQIVLLDTVPYSLGVAAIRAGTGEAEVFTRLIDRNSRIPISKSNIFTTKDDNQPNVHIKVYQGEALQPQKNYFLGDFVLEGIPPAPAHTPQIEVTFDIGADCILTVTAVDKATGNKRSIRVERAVALSPGEKQYLSNYFAQREKAYSLEKELEKLRLEIDALQQSCAEAIRTAQHSIEDFLERFHDRVEVNPNLYKVPPDQVRAIQDMIIEKDQPSYDIPRYNDRLSSILSNLRRTEAQRLDFGDSDIALHLQERIEALSDYKRSLRNILESVERDVTKTVGNWIQLLDSMEPDWDKMGPLERANHYLMAGRVNRAREILESLTSSAEGLTREAFDLLLRCYVSLGLREEYRSAHKQFGSLFGIVYPDFNRLNAYLKTVDDSIFMIRGSSSHHGVFMGSAFCVAPHLIVTNRHVIAESPGKDIVIVGRNMTCSVDRVELDPVNDLAILYVAETFRPLRLGEFDFVEPGEQVLAIGFPSPTSDMFSENIYISKGIVNSIRTIEISPDRVLFVDAKIGSGMSGGPLINDLGEVVGIITLTRYAVRPSEAGIFLMEDQPVALPIHLVRKYLMSLH